MDLRNSGLFPPSGVLWRISDLVLRVLFDVPLIFQRSINQEDVPFCLVTSGRTVHRQPAISGQKKNPVSKPKPTISTQKQGFSETRPKGLEPSTFGSTVRCLKDITTEKTKSCKKEETPSAIYSAILLQKHPDLEQIITAWPELPEHIKAAIMALIRTA